MLSIILLMLSIILLSFYYSEYYYDECIILTVIMLNVILLWALKVSFTGVGKLTYPLSANANALPVTPRSPPAGTTLM
jgi:hypothetical protein